MPGKFCAEIVPVEIPGKKGQVTIVKTDECPRRDTTMESAFRLETSFQERWEGNRGECSRLNDGAAAVAVASRSKAEEMGSQPMARIVGYCHAAVEPKYLFDAPSKAIPKLLQMLDWRIGSST